MFTAYSKYLVIMNSLELHYSKTKGNKFAVFTDIGGKC